MSSVHVMPTNGRLASGFHPSYPTNPNKNYTYVQSVAQETSEGLYRETTIGKMMVDSLTRFVVGKGLTPMAAPESEILGWTQEQVDKFQRQAEAYWRIVTSDPNFDYYGKDSFNQIQQIACKNIFNAGDTLLHLGFRKLRNGEVRPFVQLISGRMVSQILEQDKKDSVGGVIINPATGKETGYKIRTISNTLDDEYGYKVVNKYNRLGRLEFTLVQLGKSDPSLVRGIPLLTSVRDDILDINKYKSNHLLRSAMQAIFTLFLKKDVNTEEGGVSILDKLSAAGGDEVEDDGERRIDLGCGYAIELNPGEDPVLVESKTNGDDYDAYIKANIGMVASALGMSYEVAMNSFNASFSASRAGLSAAEKNFAILRDEFCTKFNNPVWEMVIDHGILSGFIEAPGYEKGGIYRKAILSVSWTGVTPPQVDPNKEVTAYVTAIEAGICTREYAVRQLYGLDYDETHERWMKEVEDMPKASEEPSEESSEESDEDEEQENEND